MAENNSEKKESRVRVRAGVLPEVREITRPDFTKRAAAIQGAEAERVLTQGDAEHAEQVIKEAESDGTEEKETGEQLDASAVTKEPHWYVAHTYSGYENKVATNLMTTIQNRHLEDQIFEVQIPLQDVVTTKENGQKKVVSQKMFPGYVLVKMIMNNDTWYVVRNTRGVTGFVGPGSKPVPLTDMETRQLGIQTRNVEVDFAVGDMIAVIAGGRLEGHHRRSTEDRLQQENGDDQRGAFRQRDTGGDRICGSAQNQLICWTTVFPVRYNLHRCDTRAFMPGTRSQRHPVNGGCIAAPYIVGAALAAQ